MGLSAAQLLEVVDAGADCDAVGRGRILLAAAAPREPDPNALSLGQRDAHVLALRCSTFGDTLTARVRCPACGVLLTVRIPREHLPPLSAPGSVELVRDGVRVVARAPDGAALAQAAAAFDVVLARAALIRACAAASVDGVSIDSLTLPDEVLWEVGEALIAAEPTLEMVLPMSCAKCGAEWASALDIVDFFWRELAAASVQLLDDVHELACGYGWSEDQVLRLSARRRREYVNRLVDV